MALIKINWNNWDKRTRESCEKEKKLIKMKFISFEIVVVEEFVIKKLRQLWCPLIQKYPNLLLAILASNVEGLFFQHLSRLFR